MHELITSKRQQPAVCGSSQLGQYGRKEIRSNQILHHLTMPGESAEYRVARNKLLTEEMALRRQIESVAALRRALPAGGTVNREYLFDGENGPLTLLDLFKPGMDTFAIYSFMFGPERELPCTGCTHFLDGLEGMVQHITQRINLAAATPSRPGLRPIAVLGEPKLPITRSPPQSQTPPAAPPSPAAPPPAAPASRANSGALAGAHPGSP